MTPDTTTHYQELLNNPFTHLVKYHIFEQQYIFVSNGETNTKSIKNVLKIWGFNEQFYNQMIHNFEQKINKNPNKHLVYGYESGDLSNDPNNQKLLFWNIYDEKTKKYTLNGGTLFYHEEMSFHT